MPAGKLVIQCVLLLFGSTILLGEAFKINIGVKISLSLVLIAIMVALALNKRLKIHVTKLDRLVYYFAALLLFYAVIGFFSGNAVGDIFEDLYPLAVFTTCVMIWRSFEIAELDRIWKVIMIFGALAAVKVMFIGILPFDIAWDNNWQAAKEPLPFVNYYRIILRGGDIFLSLAFVYAVISIHRKSSGQTLRKLLVILATGVAIFISLSRSSFLADAVAVVITFILFRSYFSPRRLAILSVTVFVLILALLPFLNIISLAASIFEARTEAFDANNIATEFRKGERELIFNKASSVYYMGNGLGSYIYQEYSGSDKTDDRSIYAHDFNTWLIFKMGIPGLIIFYLLFVGCCYNLYWCLRQKTNSLNDKYQLLILSLFAGGIVFYIISVLANKFNTLSGALFFSFFVTSSISLKRAYERSI